MPKKKDTLNEKEMCLFLRKRSAGLLRKPNVTSVGVGYKIKGGRRTDELCIQITVEEKIGDSELEAEEVKPLRKTLFTDSGIEVPTDIVERNYHSNYHLLPDAGPEAIAEDAPGVNRLARLDRMAPGCSICHFRGSAGTLGAIVYDKQTGEPYTLSNWHVLHGAVGNIGDPILQQSPHDGGTVENDLSGRLIRSHLGLAGDCAIASIEGRAFSEEIIGLGIQPHRVARAELGDAVVKSGRTTGVTYGIVRRVEVTSNMSYHGLAEPEVIGGFEIGPNPEKLAENGEVSIGGDSGSLWMIDGGDDTNDIAVGLHFAGERWWSSDEHALACNIDSVLEELNISFTERNPEIIEDEDLWNETLGRLDLLSARIDQLEQKKCECSTKNKEESVQSTPEGGLPVYGNWCGPGHGGGTPIDDLDRACMKHDQCYDRRGYFDCGCDAELVSDIDRARRTGRVNPFGHIMAPAIQSWFRVQPCTSHGVGSVSVGRGTGNLNGGLVSGVRRVLIDGRNVWKRIRRWF